MHNLELAYLIADLVEQHWHILLRWYDLLMVAQPASAAQQQTHLLWTGFVILGFISAISLLLRHWGAIERYHLLGPTEDITTPLLQVSFLSSAQFTLT